MGLSQKNLFLTYYSIIVAITFFIYVNMIDTTSVIRASYSLAVILPTIWNVRLLPLVTTCFWGVSLCMFTPLFPSTTAIVIFAIFIVLILNQNKCKFRVDIILVLIILYFVLNDVFFDSKPFQLETSIFITILLMSCVNDEEGLFYLSWGFVLMSLLISIIYIFTYKNFIYNYSNSGLDRAVWINPNYLGGHISLGTATAIWLLFNNEICKRVKRLKLLLIFSIAICIIVLIINASRGSLLSCSAAFLWYLFASKTKLKIKFLTASAIIIFLFVLYTHNYFDLLLYRLESGTTETGGGRTLIWAAKLNQYFNIDSFVTFLFGVGQISCERMAIFIKTHNDFVTAIISYGTIGILLLFILYLKPLAMVDKKQRSQLFGLLLFLIIESFVLEPLMRGYLIFILFYGFLFEFSIVSKSKNYSPI